MSDLNIDTDMLLEAGHSLRVVATELAHANANSDQAAEVVGHEGLAEHVRAFAHNWDDRRQKILDNVVALADASTGIGDAFTELEDEFVAALRGEK